MAVISRLSFVVAAVLAVGVRAESHLFKFQNNCGFGTPQLIQGSTLLSSGEDYTHSGVFSGIAYLQHDAVCGWNGDNCLMLEITLANPTAPGAGSSTDLTLIAPHKFDVPMGFSYINGCDGQGKSCMSADCGTNAFFKFDDYVAQVQCEEDNVGLLVTFCPGGVGAIGGGNQPSSSSIQTTTTEVHTTTTMAQPATSSAHSTSTSVAYATTSTSVIQTTTSKTVITPPSSTVTSTIDSSSSDAVSTIVASTSVALSSVAATTLSASSATSSSPVNRKQCKPGQKARRKSGAAKREADTKREMDAIKREALAHHRRAHGHH